MSSGDNGATRQTADKILKETSGKKTPVKPGKSKKKGSK